MIFGSDGTIKVEGPPFDKVSVGKNGDKELKDHPIADDKRGKWQVEEDFINSIRGAPVTLTPFDVGVQYMEFTEAVTRSSQTGQMVYLPL
jgi:predicted dehydrogenase